MSDPRIPAAVINHASVKQYFIDNSIGSLRLATGTYIHIDEVSRLFMEYNPELRKSFVDFVEMVKDMRAIQKRFFTTHDKRVLESAKQAEDAIDRTIRAIQTPVVQIDLFPTVKTPANENLR